MENKGAAKLIFDCHFRHCKVGSDLDYVCCFICDLCEICTPDGMAATKVKRKKDGVVYEVGHISGDEFIFSVNEPYFDVLSMPADMDKFNQEFDIVETKLDKRVFY